MVAKKTAGNPPAKTRKPRSKPKAKKAPARSSQRKPREQRPSSAAPAISRKAIKRTYLFAVGRRKTAIARVRFHPEGQGEIVINGKPLAKVFPSFVLQLLIRAPIVAVGTEGIGTYSISVSGGGVHSQAESIRHGIARVLLHVNPETRSTLKTQGYLRRDARVKERKKYGLRRARRAPQWQKR